MVFRRLIGLPAVALLVAFVAAACSTHNSFVLSDGSTIVGEVVKSEALGLEVWTHRQRNVWIDRKNVESIHLAGSGATYLGGGLVGGGIVTMIAIAGVGPGETSSEDAGFTAGMVLSGLLLGAGIGPLIWGLMHMESASAKIREGIRRPKVSVAPMLQLGPTERTVGGQLGMSF